jgi:hypothetical protein
MSAKNTDRAERIRAALLGYVMRNAPGPKDKINLKAQRSLGGKRGLQKPPPKEVRRDVVEDPGGSSIRRADSFAWQKAKAGDYIGHGDQIKTHGSPMTYRTPQGKVQTVAAASLRTAKYKDKRVR